MHPWTATPLQKADVQSVRSPVASTLGNRDVRVVINWEERHIARLQLQRKMTGHPSFGLLG